MRIFLFILGASLASATLCLAYRLNLRLSLSGFSYCDNCRQPIAPISLVPVFGWLMSFGRCAICHQRIAIKYPIIEFAYGMLFLTVDDYRVLLVFILLLFCSEEDSFNQTSSSWILLPLPFLFLENLRDVSPVFLVSLFIFLYFSVILTAQLGEGDIPVLLVLLSMLSVHYFLLAVILACIATIAYSLFSGNKKTAFIPFLTYGAMISQIIFQFG
ncbi:MAG: prepilin peptidase [Lactobacillaceae bacterium]|jgi:prepilin signal peptidase PulO-like enzyme (type II secretory pathway)|nr:prepilin peptidase [Lactobacillaceae bacterium]